jgi:hypothetical protein
MIDVTFDAPLLTIGTLPGERLPDWLSASADQTSNTRGTFNLGITDTNLEPGVYEVTLRAVSSTQDGSQVFDTIDIPITYTVTPITPITLDQNQVSFKAAPVQEPITKTVTLTGEGINWEIVTSPIGISVNPRSGTISADGQQVEIIFSPGEVRPATDSIEEISFRNADAPLSSTDLNVSIEFVDGVFTDPQSLTFETLVGDTNPQSETIKIDSFDITTESQINWTAMSDQAWLSITPNSGAVDTDMSSDTPSDVVLTVDPTGLEIGLYEAIASFENDISDQIFKLPVSFVIAERKVVTSQIGVGFASQSALETRISVEDSQGVPIDWAARTSASWLSVTPSGTAGDALIITADPAGLAENSISEAVVMVTSPLSDISNEVSIYVGLWNSDETTEEKVINIDSDQVGPLVSIAADPVRPYVYVTKSEASDVDRPARTDLYVYNSHTGEEIVSPISSQVFVSPIPVPSDDGRFLYIFPSSSDGRDGQIERYDLHALGAPTRFNVPGESLGGDVDFTRVNGVPYLITGAGGVINAETGAVLSTLRQVNGGSISASQNGRFCLRNFRLNEPTKPDCFALFGTGASGTNIAAQPLIRNQASFDPSELAISSDGNTVYVQLDDQLTAFSVEDTTESLFAIDGATNIVLSREGTILAYKFSDDFTAININAYNPDGSFIGSVPANNDPTLMEFAVSSDGKRIAILETDINTGEDILLRLIDGP